MADSGIKILRVAPIMFDQAWPHIIGLMRRGLATAPEMVNANTRIRIADGTLQVWMIVQEEPQGILAVFLTDINTERTGEKWVCVHAFAGQWVWRWARKLQARMIAFAQSERCDSVRFSGKRGWGRVFEGCRVIGELPTGDAIFERAVA